MTQRRYAALDGEGARLYGGRWSPQGIPIVYAAEHLSLAVLEVLVHAAARQFFPDDPVAIAVDIPDTVLVERVRTAVPTVPLRSRSP